MEDLKRYAIMLEACISEVASEGELGNVTAAETASGCIILLQSNGDIP